MNRRACRLERELAGHSIFWEIGSNRRMRRQATGGRRRQAAGRQAGVHIKKRESFDVLSTNCKVDMFKIY